jgi:hypothetical protein
MVQLLVFFLFILLILFIPSYLVLSISCVLICQGYIPSFLLSSFHVGLVFDFALIPFLMTVDPIN